MHDVQVVKKKKVGTNLENPHRLNFGLYQESWDGGTVGTGITNGNLKVIPLHDVNP